MNLYIYYLIIPVLLVAFYKLLLNNEGKELKKNFQKIGDMTGLTLEEITKAVKRKPKLTNRQSGKLLVTWAIGKYSINIQFNDDGVFETINNAIEANI